MTLEKLLKAVPNHLDRVEVTSDGFKVSFFADERDRDERCAVLRIRLDIDEGDTELAARVASSQCLPTYDWGKVAAAYARAAEFLSLSKIKDCR